MSNENVQTNEELINEFESLFGGTSEEESEEEIVETSESEEIANESEGEDSEEDLETEESTKESEDEKPSQKQAHAFYTLRNEIKEKDKVLQSIGKAIGLDVNVSTEELISTINSLVMQKEAKDQGVPLEYLQRLNALEQQVQEAQNIKQEATVTKELTALAEEFNLDETALTEFVLELAKDGKNPLTVENVDLKAEYLKLHINDLIENAKASALADETARKDKIKDKASKTVPPKKGGNDGVEEVKTLAELDAMLDAKL